MTVGWPIASISDLLNTDTVKNFRIYKKTIKNIWVESEFHFVLDKIATLPTQIIKQIIDQHPDFWLTNTESQFIFDFWDNGGRASRLAEIRGELANGHIL